MTGAKTLRERITAAETVRKEREGLWRTVQNFCFPASLTYREEQGSGDERERRLADSTAVRSLELFASFLLSNVFVAGAVGTQSFWIKPEGTNGEADEDLLRQDMALRQWCDLVAKRVRSALFTGKQSAVAALHKLCLDLGAYGSACFAVWEDSKARKGIRFQHIPVWEVSGEADAEGETCAVYVRKTFRARAALMKFPALTGKVNAEKDTPVEMLYACIRTDDPEIKNIVPEQYLATGAEWVGIWLHPETETYADVGVFLEQPIFLVPWYSVDDGVWGRSPAMTALGEVAQANSLSELITRGAEKLVDPPWMVRDGALLSPLRLYPAGITYTDGDRALEPLLPPGASRIEVGVDMLSDKERRIREAFFIHLFMDQNPTGSKQPRTVGEIMVNQDERNRAVSPMVLRLQNSLLEPLIWRVLGVLTRQGRLPPPPAQPGQAFIVQHLSPVITSAMQTEAMAAVRWLEGVAFISQLDPQAADVVNADAVASLLHSASGVPARLMRSRQEIEAIRQARAEQQQMMTGAAVAAEAGNTMAKLISATGSKQR
jgi:hypothetical protein